MFVDVRNRLACALEFNIPPNGKGVTLYNDTGSTIARGDIVTVGYDPDGVENIIEPKRAIANATTAFPVYTAVAIEDVVDGSVGFFQIEGECQAFIEGTDAVVKGDFLEVLNTANEWIKDGAARTTVSGAIALAAQGAAGNVLTKVFLIGEQHTIAAA